MKNAKTILYLGGSITCGACASDYEHSWAMRSFCNIAPILYGDQTKMINASISGTGSRVAVYRLAEHVLPYRPDLVFIEFSVNDNETAKTDPDLIVANLEYIVRSLKASNPNVAVTFVYTTNSSGENASRVHSVVAQHYDIPEIDLRAPLMAKIEAGENEWADFLYDTAHPVDRGHAFYADVVTRAVLADPARYTAPIKDVPPLTAESYCNPRIASPSEAVAMDGFCVQAVEDDTKLKHLPELAIREGAYADRVGASLSFKFEGEKFGVYYRIGSFGGRFCVTIDSKEYGGDDCYYDRGDGAAPWGEYISRYYVHSLSPGTHTATVTVLEPNPRSKGSEISIAGFFVDEP